MGNAPATPAARRFPPWLLIAVGAAVIAATYLYLVVWRPESLVGGAGVGPAALIALVGYLLGSVLIIAGAMVRMPTSTVTLLPIAIAINIVAGQINNMVGLPLYLDSIGTVLVGVLAGPAAGAATGALSNVIWGISISPASLPFSTTQVVIGLLAGLFARYGWTRRILTAVIAGAVTGVAAAVVSGPISAFVFGGANASAGRSAIVAIFQALGIDTLGAAILQGLTVDPLDKAIAFLVAIVILRALPMRFSQRFPFARTHSVFSPRTRSVLRGGARPAEGEGVLASPDPRSQGAGATRGDARDADGPAEGGRS
ncbi:energy-coupling factor transport system substrate-specific component [Spinactinospora alkalitolerans]|uniref:Energy-coupling factor transport system substrate-specific component n=1 Tax=Spinactinospora alkalitolerans TaxID=687207 RepID=A0A852TWU7_9ACTN|nr:histidine kinase [Spinactinospora alkalitolerans]NYE47313.1 energy-coupling factor transport system substrate-specific component [Spinactinospora alkalitolerans]